MKVDVFGLCDAIRDIGYSIHRFHRNGNLEKVYENALFHRLHKAGYEVAQQHPVPVYDEDGTLLGNYMADLLIAGTVIVEIKAVAHVLDEHVAQLLGYLRSSRIEHGLLISFGAPKFYIRKYILNDRAEVADAFGRDELAPAK